MTPENQLDEPARVLLVDDEPVLLRVCELSLRGAGMTVTSTSTAEQAVELLDQNRYDVVVSDILMPGMSGLDLLRRLREHGRQIPVLLMTATPEISTAAQAVEYGAFRYFIKPVDALELERAVAHAARLSRRTQISEAALGPSGEPTTPAPELFTNDGSVDPLVGRCLLGNFQLQERLGEGSAGRVYRATQLSLDKEVAVKVLHPQLTLHPMFVERFKREAFAASRLSHPNSVQVIEFGRDPALGVFFIVMERIKGRDLQSVLASEGPFSAERAVRILRQVLAALSEAHQTGIVHRDLKPENVILLDDRDDQIDFVKVCDFGIALVVGTTDAGRAASGKRLTGSGLVNGTPQYMAPEQVRGERADARTDVYAAGVLLYEMVTGRCPFEGPDTLAVVQKQLHDAPMPPSVLRDDVDPAFEAVILRALEKNPANRQQSAAELRHELESVIEILHGEGKLGRTLVSILEGDGSPPPSIPPDVAAPPPASAVPDPADSPAPSARSDPPMDGPAPPRTQARRRGTPRLVAMAVSAIAIAIVGAALLLRRGAVRSRPAAPRVSAPAATPPAPVVVLPEPVAPAPLEEPRIAEAPVEPGRVAHEEPARRTNRSRAAKRRLPRRDRRTVATPTAEAPLSTSPAAPAEAETPPPTPPAPPAEAEALPAAAP